MATPLDTILVVDDVEENVDILVDMLGANYDVSVAMDGETALRAVASNPPRIILLDIMMPRMDGFEVCRRLKANPATRAIPVIFISAIEDHESKVKALTLGGVDYVCKPFNPNEVRARVTTHLELARIRRELEETLSQTLTGTIQMLSDILSMMNPDLFSLATRLRTAMRAQCRIHGLDPVWSFELAGLFLPVGMLAMSPMLLQKLSVGTPFSGESLRQLDSNVELSAQLLARIPRMEDTADVIRQSTQTPRDILAGGRWDALPKNKKAALILRVLRDSQQIAQEHMSAPAFLSVRLKELLGAQVAVSQPEGISLPDGQFSKRDLSIAQMKEGMILMEDIFSKESGRKLAGVGFMLTHSVLVLLARYRDRGEIDSTRTFRVSVPG